MKAVTIMQVLLMAVTSLLSAFLAMDGPSWVRAADVGLMVFVGIATAIHSVIWCMCAYNSLRDRG